MAPNVKIYRAKIHQSPVILNSSNVSVSFGGAEPRKKSLFENPWIKQILLPVFVGILIYLLWGFVSEVNQMGQEPPKVNIEDSNLTQSPVIVDSPNTKVEYNIVNKVGIPGPAFEIEAYTKYLTDLNYYETKGKITIIYQGTLNSWLLEIASPEVISMNLEIYGAIMNVQEITGQGYAAVGFDRPYGTYNFTVHSSTPVDLKEKLKVTYQ